MATTRKNNLAARALCLAVFFFSAAFGLPAFAQTPLKVAVVDIDQVFLRSSIGQTLRKELLALENQVKARLEGQTKAGVDLQSRLASASPEEKRPIERQLEDIQLTVRRVRDDAQRQADKLEADRRKEFETKLVPIFEAIQAESAYDLILNKTAGVVIFAGPTIEITQTVLERVK